MIVPGIAPLTRAPRGYPAVADYLPAFFAAGALCTAAAPMILLILRPAPKPVVPAA